MSLIGKLPVSVPSGVQVTFDGERNLIAKGPKGTLVQHIDTTIDVAIDGSVITFSRHNDLKEQRSKHGLYRSLVSNMLKGVSTGYKITQELVGVGYRATAKADQLELLLGYSHNIIMVIPSEVKVTTTAEKGQNPTIILESHDHQLIGQVAAKIRSLRKPEPYKGKGIKFAGEVLRRKAGKSASKK